MIDFSATQTDKTETLIEFVNDNGEVVKTYPLSDLEDYVLDNNLNLTYEDVFSHQDIRTDHRGNTDYFDVYEDVEVYQDVTEYIDDNWEELTKQFYISRNPSEFKASAHYNKTKQSLK